MQVFFKPQKVEIKKWSKQPTVYCVPLVEFGFCSDQISMLAYSLVFSDLIRKQNIDATFCLNWAGLCWRGLLLGFYDLIPELGGQLDDHRPAHLAVLRLVDAERMVFSRKFSRKHCCCSPCSCCSNQTEKAKTNKKLTIKSC